MRFSMCVGLAVMVLSGGAGAAMAQGAAGGSSIPDSNMAPPSGNTGDAGNGIGQQGRLTGNEGSHSSTVTGAAAAAAIPTSPKPANGARNDPQVEKDPSQGGTQPH